MSRVGTHSAPGAWLACGGPWRLFLNSCRRQCSARRDAELSKRCTARTPKECADLPLTPEIWAKQEYHGFVRALFFRFPSVGLAPACSQYKTLLPC